SAFRQRKIVVAEGAPATNRQIGLEIARERWIEAAHSFDGHCVDGRRLAFIDADGNLRRPIAALAHAGQGRVRGGPAMQGIESLNALDIHVERGGIEPSSCRKRPPASGLGGQAVFDLPLAKVVIALEVYRANPEAPLGRLVRASRSYEHHE